MARIFLVPVRFYISVEEKLKISSQISIKEIHRQISKAVGFDEVKRAACSDIVISFNNKFDFLSYDSATFTLTMTGNENTYV